MEKNYREKVNSIVNLGNNVFNFINSRNAVHGLVDFDKYPLDKIEWHPESVLTKTCNFTFEIGDGIINQYYDKDFDYNNYFEQRKGYSLPIKKYDFSIDVSIEDCVSLKLCKLAKVGLKYSDVFKDIKFCYLDDKIKQSICLISFEIIFSRLLSDNKYLDDKKKTIDIGLIIIDVLEQLPVMVSEKVKEMK